MGKFSGCVLASDADGTLFGSDGVISKRNIDAVKRFTDEGGKFIAATGRTADAARFIYNTLNVNAPCVLSNGAQLYDYETDSPVWETYLSDGEVKPIFAVVSSPFIEKSGIEIHSGNTVYVVHPTPESTEHETRENLKTEIIDVCAAKKIKNVFKLLITVRTEEEFAPLEDFVRKSTDCELKIVHTTATFGTVKYHYLEILPFGVSKATALKELVKLQNISADKIFAIGDYYNDLEMLMMSGVSAVAAGAPDDIKHKVDYVVCDGKTGAVGNFIELLEEKFK